MAEACQVIRLKGHSIGTGFHNKDTRRINWHISKHNIVGDTYLNKNDLKIVASMLIDGKTCYEIMGYFKQKQC